MIEPCCCERQLPRLLSDYNGRAACFTNGDVTVSHFFKSVSYLAGSSHTMVLVVREADVKLLRWLKTWMERGWTTGVMLTTATDARELVAAELEGLTDRVSVATDATVGDELIAFEGEKGVVVVAGRMLTAAQPGLTVYALYHHHDRGMMDDLLAAIEARHRSHLCKMEDVRGKKEEGKGTRKARKAQKEKKNN